MRHILILIVMALVANDICGQDTEVKEKLSLYGPKRQKRWVSIGDNLTFATYNIPMSAIENEIANLEARECKAVLKRDTIVLKQIWKRDFTLDEPIGKLVSGKNPLPFYTSLIRVIEKFSTTDNLAFASGYELGQQLSATGKLEDPIKQTFFHTWTKKNGIWKLSTKTKD